MAKKAAAKSRAAKSAAVKSESAPEIVVKRSVAMVVADAQAMTAADGGAQQITTFPPNDCQAGLPPSESFHDVTFAEFKRLNRKIKRSAVPDRDGGNRSHATPEARSDG